MSFIIWFEKNKWDPKLTSELSLMNYFLLITHYPYLYKKFALFNPTKSGQFMAISADLTQLEEISKLLTNSCGGEIISPQKKLILVVGRLVLLSSRRKKIESLESWT